MPDNIKIIADHALPFMVAAANAGAAKVNAQRIIEAVIIAGLVGAITWVLTIPKLQTEFQYIQRDIKAVSVKVDAIDAEVDELRIAAAIEKARHLGSGP